MSIYNKSCWPHELLDKINTEWGGGMLTFVAESLRKNWLMNRSPISKRYTMKLGLWLLREKLFPRSESEKSV